MRNTVLDDLTRRHFITLLAAMATVTGACSDDGGTANSGDTLSTTSLPPTTGPVGSRPPNVLYIAADDLGTQLGAYGHPNMSTPRLDAFAADSLLFEQCHVQSPICGASRTSILTGLRPETTRVLDNTTPWRDGAPDAVTLVRHFRDNGYRTYGLGKINDERNGPLDDAWDVAPAGPALKAFDDVATMLELVASDGQDPFFLAIGFIQPHCPWEPSDESLSLYTPADVTVEIGAHRQVGSGYLQRCAPDLRPDSEPAEGEVTISDDEAFAIAQRYLASVTDLDGWFGATIDLASDLGLLDNTIVIFWSGDHGYSLGHNQVWGKWLPFDVNTRIPLMMKLPDGRGRGARASALVEALDMFPTLLELCELPSPPQVLEGVSMVPLFDDPRAVTKSAVFSRFGNQRSVRTATHALIVNDFWETSLLFDRIIDPLELSDISTESEDTVEELRRLLDATSPADLGEG